MSYRICPKCTSWQLKTIKTTSISERLLNIVNLRLYQCKDCGWRGIARSKKKQGLIKVLRQPSVWKNILNSFLMLAGVFTISILLISIMGKYITKGQITSPSTAKNVESEITADTGSGENLSDKIVTSDVNTATHVKDSEQPLAVSIQKSRVIGNRDSKRYHLPGMKYYHLVEAHHRIEFSSEDEAIRAGYHKALR